MRIATVLKSGGEFRTEHVCDLAESILQHNPDAQIVCLSDKYVDHHAVEVVTLKHGWPKWWSKIELFRPGVCPGPTLYMDLDTVVVGKIDIEIAGFTMLADVYRRGGVGSGVMAWNSPPTHIYHQFCKAPVRYMASYRTRNRWGDQAFIRDKLRDKPLTFNEKFRSYKVHCKNGIPPGAEVVYFHGKPRPWQVRL